MAPVRLPRLHRGYWFYQSSRILLLAAYLSLKGLSESEIARIIEEHVEYVSVKLRHVREKIWIVERLDMLGYQPKRPRSSSVAQGIRAGIISEYVNKLGLDSVRDKLVETMEALSDVLGARRLDSLAYLPPVLSLPEKLLLLRAIASSKHFALLEVLRAIGYTTLGRDIHEVIEGEVNTVNREFRFRFCHLYNLHMVGGTRRDPRLTGLGSYTLAAALEGVDPLTAYTVYAAKTGRMQRMIVLDVLAFDMLTLDKLEELLEYEARMLEKQGLDYGGSIVEEARRLLTPMPSDKPGVYFVAPVEPIDALLEKLYL